MKLERKKVLLYGLHGKRWIAFQRNKRELKRILQYETQDDKQTDPPWKSPEQKRSPQSEKRYKKLTVSLLSVQETLRTLQLETRGEDPTAGPEALLDSCSPHCRNQRLHTATSD